LPATLQTILNHQNYAEAEAFPILPWLADQIWVDFEAFDFL